LCQRGRLSCLEKVEDTAGSYGIMEEKLNESGIYVCHTYCEGCNAGCI